MTGMDRTQESHQKTKSSWILLVLLLLAAGFFYFLGTQETKTSQKLRSSQISAYSNETNEVVNKHLSITSQALEIKRKKMNIENQFSAPQIGESVVSKEQKPKDYGVDHSADTNESNAYEDLNRYRHELRATDPDRIIRDQIAEQEDTAEYDQAYREEYARQFIENARRNGYEVKLNSDYVVISVKKIKSSGNFDLGRQAR